MSNTVDQAVLAADDASRGAQLALILLWKQPNFALNNHE